jgi:hypothetical protein
MWRIVAFPPIRGLFPRPLEVAMNIRSIVVGACALCLAIPAAAVASPGTDQPKGPYGVTAATGPSITAKAEGPYGVMPDTGPATVAKAKGPYGVMPETGPTTVAKAKGPYGVTPATGLATVAGATAHPAATARSDDTAAWRIVALCEAALLAAFALAAAHLVPRRRAPRLVT